MSQFYSFDCAGVICFAEYSDCQQHAVFLWLLILTPSPRRILFINGVSFNMMVWRYQSRVGASETAPHNTSEAVETMVGYVIRRGSTLHIAAELEIIHH